MKEGADLLPTSASAAAAAAKGSSGGGGVAAASEAALLGKGRYKFWALGAIVLLAFWSMLTGTVTLKWSAGDLARFSDDLDNPLHDDLDVLEMEEREKMVRHMWDVYAHSEQIRLPRFWQQAFEAAYEELAGDDARVRDAAVAEIARMSLRMVDLEPPPRHRRHGAKNTEMENKQRDSSSRSKGKSTTLLSTGA